MNYLFNQSANSSVAIVFANPLTGKLLLQNTGASTLHFHQEQKAIVSIDGAAATNTGPVGTAASAQLLPGESIALVSVLNTTIHTGPANVGGSFDVTPLG